MAEFLGLAGLLFAALVIGALALRYPSIWLPLWVGFIARALVALTDFYVFPMPYGQTDAVMFQRIASQMASGSLAELLDAFTTDAFIYSWTLGLLYFWTGPSRLLAQAINVLLGTLLVLIVYKTACRLPADRILARRAAWIVSLFPALVILSAVPIRDAAVMLLIAGAIYYAVIWVASDHIWDLLKALCVVLVGIAFHTGVLSLLMALGVFASLRTAGHVGRDKAISALVGLLILTLFATLTLAIYQTGWGLGKIADILDGGIDQIGEAQLVRSRARALYLEDLSITSWLDLVWQSPIRALYFLLTPFPWWVSHVRDLFGIMDALLYATFLYVAYRGRDTLTSSETGQLLLLFALFGILLFALGTSNYGTALRHRAKFAELLILVTVLTHSIPRRVKSAARRNASA